MTQVASFAIPPNPNPALNVLPAINNMILALRDLNSGSVEPTATAPYMLWMDTNAGFLRMMNAANNAWLPLLQGAGYGATISNPIINGSLVAAYSINQRSFNGSWSSLSNGNFGYDRWYKDGTDVKQKVEDGSYFYSSSYTLSYTNSSGQRVTQAITAPSSGHWTITVPNTASFVQLEIGPANTRYHLRNRALELALCQRYYQAGEATANGPSMANRVLYVPFKVSMRVAPTITRTGNGAVTSATSSSYPTLGTTEGFYFLNPDTTTAVGGSYIADAEI